METNKPFVQKKLIEYIRPLYPWIFLILIIWVFNISQDIAHLNGAMKAIVKLELASGKETERTIKEIDKIKVAIDTLGKENISQEIDIILQDITLPKWKKDLLREMKDAWGK